ncbi:SNase-domain-containing protein [Abortiporus biennis]|nr:SNase-domain-containing protein [Abortiporus biennis]
MTTQEEILRKGRELTDTITDRINALPPGLLVLSAFALGSVSTLAGTFAYRRYYRRIPNSDWITPDMFSKKRWVKGKVVSVGDNDNFRIYHTPGLGWRWPLKFRRIPKTSKALKDQTIHIRLAGVDAPEASHFGRPSQLFSEDSLEWLKKQVEGKTVYCQLLRNDQYSRTVALAYLKPRILPASIFKGKNLSVEMLQAGWATVYEQAGAEYGDYGKDEFLRIQADAQAARRGIWRKGLNNETPAEYKRRYARSTVDAETATNSGSQAGAAQSQRSVTKPRLSLWRKIWSKKA